MAAVVALICMAAQGSGSAFLDGAHGPPLVAGQSMGLSISRTVLTEDIRHLKADRGSHPFSGLGKRSDGLIEGGGNLGQIEPTHMQIDGGGCGGSMAQKQLDMVETRSCFNQMGGKAVPQGMDAGRFGDVGLFLGFVE